MCHGWVSRALRLVPKLRLGNAYHGSSASERRSGASRTEVPKPELGNQKRIPTRFQVPSGGRDLPSRHVHVLEASAILPRHSRHEVGLVGQFAEPKLNAVDGCLAVGKLADVGKLNVVQVRITAVGQ